MYEEHRHCLLMQRTQPQYLDLEAYLADDETRASSELCAAADGLGEVEPFARTAVGARAVLCRAEGELLSPAVILTLTLTLTP